MALYYRVKITVMQKLGGKDIFGEEVPYLVPEMSPVCDHFEIGQEYIVDNISGDKPDGFCTWAWNDIYKMVLTLSSGGNFTWITKEGLVYACCTDGARPVFFKLERMPGAPYAYVPEEHAKRAKCECHQCGK